MLKIPATFTNFSPRSDRSVNLKFTSMLEVPNEYFTELAGHRGLSGWLLFSEQQISEAPKEELPDKEKSQAKRIRNALYVLHEQRGGKKEDFENFYYTSTEKIIERIKSSLD